ncbi:AH receptor-interacting protein-like [Paramacrobiotus metropolitanus]|uniref:AH receptor-interacting protein-like n=1 Tax=Paramacrobiotus metropolitanus TaxID=2943436 RepID=UPI0024456CD0|nr:AH receptor-interacting protein-like [Paramacrobiotus metropolitanus]
MLPDKIRKHILKEGTDAIPVTNDTKIKFFYKTIKPDGTILDDNNAQSDPLEMLFGKQFKLEVWEECLKTMRLHEIARFSVDRDLLSSYPLVAKSLRDIAKGKAPNSCGHDHGDGGQHRCCGMQTLMEQGLGYPDLDALIKKPEDLDFEFQIVDAQSPGSYEKDPWAMDVGEKMENVPKLHEEGNHLYKRQKYVEAADRYSKALGLLEELTGHEKPQSEEWMKLDKMMIPLLLNYTQCQLILGHYNEAIQHTTTVIEKDPVNVKAWYRRAKAHAMAWNPKEAREDFAKAAQLDPALKNAIDKDLRELDNVQKIRDVEDKERMKKLFG